jgi:hypothetical protein
MTTTQKKVTRLAEQTKTFYTYGTQGGPGVAGPDASFPAPVRSFSESFKDGVLVVFRAFGYQDKSHE